MSRLPPASARLSCGSLNYAAIGSSSRYFEFQLKQNLALDQAWSVNACLFFNSGRLSKLRRKLLVHALTMPINGALRARKLFELQWCQSQLWYISKFRSGGSDLVLIRGDCRPTYNSRRVCVARPDPGQARSTRGPEPGVNVRGLALAVAKFDHAGPNSELRALAYGQPPQAYFKSTPRTGPTNPPVNARVAPNSGKALGHVPTDLRQAKTTGPRSRQWVFGQPPSTGAAVEPRSTIRVAQGALNALAGCAGSQSGYSRPRAIFNLGAWTQQVQVRRGQGSGSARTLTAQQVSGRSRLDVSPRLAESRAPRSMPAIAYTHSGGTQNAGSTPYGRHGRVGDPILSYASNPSPRLALARTYNDRPSLVKFSFTEGHYTRSRGQNLRCLRSYRKPGLKRSPNQHQVGPTAGVIRVQALRCAENLPATPSIARATRYSLLRSKSCVRFELALNGPVFGDPGIDPRVSGGQKVVKPSMSLRL